MRLPKSTLFACISLGMALALPLVTWAADTVGASTCGTCHPDAYEAWKRGPHARAEEALSPRQRGSARCQRCHAPAREEGFAGVQCEACHGPGRYYYPEYVMRDAELARAVGLVDPSKETCKTCHAATAPNLKPFRFEEKLDLIRHWPRREAEPASSPKADARSGDRVRDGDGDA